MQERVNWQNTWRLFRNKGRGESPGNIYAFLCTIRVQYIKLNIYNINHSCNFCATFFCCCMTAMPMKTVAAQCISIQESASFFASDSEDRGFESRRVRHIITQLLIQRLRDFLFPPSVKPLDSRYFRRSFREIVLFGCLEYRKTAQAGSFRIPLKLPPWAVF